MSGGEQRALAEKYRAAATERIVCANDLYYGNRFVEACYIAGLAVENMLRGYRVKIDSEFDSRHDIYQLYKLAKFGDAVPRALDERVTAALGDVVTLWSNEYRFWPETALKESWKKKGLFRWGGKWIKGDFVKELTRKLVTSAEVIVNTGDARWQA